MKHQTILFKYYGALYRFEHLVESKFESYTRATSKEQAISHIKTKAKSTLGYSNSAKIDLVGTLAIYYNQDIREYYDINRNEISLKESDIKITKTESGLSLEETKYYYLFPEEDSIKWYVVYMNGNREDVTNKISIRGSCITYGEDEYFYDDDNGVYWKDAIPYNDRIEQIK